MTAVNTVTGDAPPRAVETLARPPEVRPRLRQARWLLLATFLLVYLAAERSIPRVPGSFVVLTLVNAAACALLLTRLYGPWWRTLWAWATLGLFLNGYFLLMSWFLVKLNSPEYINRNYAEIRWVTTERILDAYPWTTLGFVTFCIAGVLALVLTPEEPPKPLWPEQPKQLLGAPAFHVAVGVFLVYLFSVLVAVSLDYGVLGAATPDLPLYLGTILTLFQTSIAPAFFILCIWVLDQTNSRLANITVVFLAVSAIANSSATTSRGSFLGLCAPAAILWLLTGRLTTGRKAAVVAGLLLAILLFPVLSSVRSANLGSTVSTSGVPRSVDEFVEAGFLVVSRLGAGGTAGVWWAMDRKGVLSSDRLVTFLRPKAMTRHYTESVVQVPSPNDFRAPGVVGSTMIIGGALGVVLLTFLIVAAIVVFWTALRRLAIWPVALSMATVQTAIFVSGGVFDWYLFIKLTVGLTMCEVVYRRLLQRPTISPIVAQVRLTERS